MNKAFEKILENIENLKLPFPDECHSYYKNTNELLDEAKKIVQEVAEEYNNGWITCSGCKECHHKECDRMKIYISGAISGADNYEECFRKAEEYLTEKGWEVLNPTGIKVDNLTYEQYMEIDLMLLNYADAIYMLKGWEKSFGANRELGYAIAKKKTVFYEYELIHE